MIRDTLTVLDALASLVGYAALTVSFGVALLAISAPFHPAARHKRREQTGQVVQLPPRLRLVEPEHTNVVPLRRRERDGRPVA